MPTKSKREAYLDFGTPFYFDAVTSEETEHTASVTEHAVEEGSNVSDHIRQEADRITLKVMVSNTPIADVNQLYNGRVAGLELKVEKAARKIPLTPGALMGAGIDAIRDALNGPEQWKALTLQFPEKFNNVSFVLGTLLDWKKRGVVGKVITPHRTYPNVVITSVTMHRDGTTGDAAPITIDMRTIRIVETKSETFPIASETRGHTMQAKGRQPTTPLADEGNKRSTAMALLNLGRGRQ